MLKQSSYRAVLSLVILAAMGSLPQAAAATESLESSALRVEVNTAPYSFRVLERSTGQVLLSHSQTLFSSNHSAATTATNISKTTGGLHMNLNVASGAKAEVTFKFVSPQIMQVTIDGGSAGEIAEEFNDQGEHYYGIWEYPFGGNIDNRGADADFLGVQREPDVNFSSARAPFYVTSRKYGLYVESTAPGHYTIAKGGKTTVSFQEGKLKYDVIYGPSYADVMNRYNTLAGPAIMPPTWAFATIWWRDDHHKDLRDVSNAQGKVIQDADKLRELHIPAGTIWLDRPYGTGEYGWGNMDFDDSFPDSKKMIGDLHDRGMNLIIWVANRCSNKLYDEGNAKGYLFPMKWPAADMRKQDAYDWFKDKLSAYVKAGVKGYKIDRGEEAEMPRSLENLNAILFPKMAAEGLADVNGKDFFNFTRNVNDTARKYTAVWNGDTRPTFGGLSVSVKHVQRSGAINFPMWGSDTGGYLGDPNKEVFARWLEFSSYSPMMEVLIGPKRTIWYDFDKELVDIARTSAAAHHDLLPYSRSYLYKATQTGMPLVRSLIFAYPQDEKLADLWDEYLFGGEILVAPVVTAGATNRDVYLPAGRWIDYNDRATVRQGGTMVSAAAPLNTIPVFAREGAIIPRGDILKANNNWTDNWKPSLRVEVFPAVTGDSSFDYYTGDSVKKISAASGRDGISVNSEDLGTEGAFEIYCSGVTGVTRNGAALHEGSDYQFDKQANKLTVPFKGATKLTVKGGKSLFAPASQVAAR